MAASATDKFRKGVAQWSGNIGSAGVADAVVKTVPLASTSGLPTDTAVMITVNRVDTNGKKTGNYEGIVGVVSGSNLIDCIRGVEGTAQAWTGGTVVEVLHTADNLNDLIDGILAEHNQDGTHKDTLVTSLKATGAVVNTGTSDVTIVTPKALADSDYAKTTDITVTADSTTTFSNKRINPRIVTAASYTTDTGTALDVSTCDIFQVTAQAGALKLNNPSGTPVAGQKLIVRIKDNGTARALTYDTQFRASSDLALPSTTVVNKTLYMGFIYNATDTKWDLLAVLNNF
jgi:hypothetical protein